MKKKVSLALLLCVSVALTGGTYTNEETAYEALNKNQPINRVVLDKNQMPQMEQPADETYEYTYDDPYLSYQWAVAKTNSNLAWEEMSGDNEVIVAIIDTGVDYTHEDLENRVLVDLGYNFVDNNSDPMDDNGHGTHVAGIIAAEADNGVGIAGVVGDLDVSILPIKALDADGVGATADITKAILYAVEMDADIINLSLGATTVTADVRSAIESALDAEIFVVVAAGNDSAQCLTTSLANIDGVFTVAASDVDDTLAYFSNYGDCVDAYAPGVEILSTYLDNQYAYQDGTSMAAPIVTGAAAILLSQDASLTIEELTAALSANSTISQTTGNVTGTQQVANPMQQMLPSQMQGGMQGTMPNQMMSQMTNQMTNGMQSGMTNQMTNQMPNGVQTQVPNMVQSGTNMTTTTSFVCSAIDIYQALLNL